MAFVVAGASGNVGSAVVTSLAASGESVKALTRSSASEKISRLKDLPGIQIVQCDLTDPSTLQGLFAGARGAFLCYGNCKQQAAAEKGFIDCAVAEGCPYLVKLGTVRSYTSLDSPIEYARYHAEIEAHLESTAGQMKWTVLCPNWFFSNHLGDLFGGIPQKNVVAYPIDTKAKATMVDPRDVADVAVALLLAEEATQSRCHKLKLDISGPEEVSTSDIAQMFTEALGREIQAVNCEREEWLAVAAQAGALEDWHARAVLLNFPLWKAGDLVFPTSAEVLQLAPPKRTMRQWIQEWAPRSPPLLKP
uniref:NmrA-like domain-containing protein n=1 Tax=Chromera velia CCMP2878 TaxID=1169474 RepID=A0A0G4FJC2_9ALVE|eukprot:Cvel_17127.t1-p1 / transcript=Cvel_17127.t1 / gene=Cvel_17127 / organism=Chromera_velia_CCMP2878 / gene_product=NAD(P)H azoreductase, putative / transcript_product=NAD(P)H azoreductase, putative / location=Cvel_scaffold1351:32269-33183(+) / protein_length=305 / sequence_SO=supercontig / SO=protein_coding / is_pseudo=false